MQHRSILFLILTCLVFAPVTPVLAKDEPLEFGYIELPPFGYTNGDGRIDGYLAEVAKVVFERMELPVRFRELPASRLYHQIATGDTAMTLGPAGLHQLADHAYESGEPAITLTLSVYRRTDAEPVSSIEELRGKRVILMQGYSYGRLAGFFETAADSMDLKRARTHASALNMLLYERGDYLLSYQVPVENVMAEHGLSGLEADVIGQVPIHYFVSHEIDSGQKLVDQWDHHLAVLQESNELPRLSEFVDAAD